VHHVTDTFRKLLTAPKQIFPVTTYVELKGFALFFDNFLRSKLYKSSFAYLSSLLKLSSVIAIFELHEQLNKLTDMPSALKD